ncbi:MAG: VWA domain-containing protein, partial [Pyrinomonadaceae bacterium]
FEIRAKGMTVLNDAVMSAANDLAGRTEKRRAIVVLSDGADTASKASEGKALDRALAAGVTIYAVDMSATPERGPASRDAHAAGSLKNFTSKSGGRYVGTPGGPAMRDAFAGIAEELGNQYTIAYRPSNRARDGRWRTIEIKLSRPQLSARTRKGYRAQKQ